MGQGERALQWGIGNTSPFASPVGGGSRRNSIRRMITLAGVPVGSPAFVSVSVVAKASSDKGIAEIGLG